MVLEIYAGLISEMDEFNDIPWKIISTYFRHNPTALIDHHLVSYNAFFDKGIKQVLKEKNGIRFIKDQHKKSKDFQHQASLYIGGKHADKLYVWQTSNLPCIMMKNI